MPVIRKARADDHADMLRIWLAASRIGHPFLGEEVLLSQRDKVRDVYFHAADNWIAVDAASLGFIGLLGGHIGGLFVDPEAYRRGVGRLLIGHAASRLGALTVDVYERNGPAIAFYHRCGFEVVGKRDRDDEGRDFTLLELRRPAASN